MERDSIRLAMGVRDRKDVYRVRKVIKRILSLHGCSLLKAWAFQDSAKMLRVINDVLLKLKPDFPMWNAGVCRVAIMHCLVDSGRTLRRKPFGYRSRAPLGYTRGPPRKKKYAMDPNKSIEDQPVTKTTRKTAETSTEIPTETRPYRRNVNAADHDSPEPEQSDDEDEDASQRPRRQRQKGKQKATSTTGKSKTTVASRKRKAPTESESDSESGGEVEADDVGGAEDEEDHESGLADTVSSNDKTPGPQQHLPTPPPTSRQRKSIRTNSKHSTSPGSATPLPSMPPPTTPNPKIRQSSVASKPRVKPASPVAYVRIEFVNSRSDMSTLASFGLSLYKKHTLRAFVVSIEKNIGYELDLKSSFLLYVPIGNPDGPWKIIRDVQDLSRMFIVEGKSRGVYMTTVDLVGLNLNCRPLIC